MDSHNDVDMLRKVRLDDYTLMIWDTHRIDGLGKSTLGYCFSKGDDVIFEGEDFSASPMHAIDSDDVIRSLMCFLTLRPGDTDRDYFNNYTSRQWEFVNSDAEMMSIWGMDDVEMNRPEIVDID